MSKPNLSPLQLALQKAALPGVWSRGVSLAKDGTFYLEADGATESIVQIVARRAGSPEKA